MAGVTADLDLKTMQQVAACGYEPVERKGQGAYGFVYEVEDGRGDLFAFKYLIPDATYLTNGLDGLIEIDILSRIHHPYIIHSARIITAFNCDIDGLAIILPLAERTLFDVALDVNMTTDQKLPLLYRLATALAFLHRSHILHLDIKSTNVVLQGDIPYLIDFGLSMVVDNVTIGKYDGDTRVTIDHRAPEILNGGRVYNAAVDIWAFGIMMLYVLSGKGIYTIDFTTVKEPQMYQAVISKFTNIQTLPLALNGVREKYRNLAIDLLSRILQIDPVQRPTAQEICDHPLFAEFRREINGTIDIPAIPYDYAADHRDNLMTMISWAQKIYPQSRAELLFLAVDLFNRIDSFYKDGEVKDRLNIAAVCLWIAAKLTNGPPVPLTVYIPELLNPIPNGPELLNTIPNGPELLNPIPNGPELLNPIPNGPELLNTTPNITTASILGSEIAIVHLLSGILHVSNLYTACTTGDELKLSYKHVILSESSTLYARTDVPAWIQVMKGYIVNPPLDKNITIRELVA